MGAALPKYLTECIGTFFLVLAASLGGGPAAGIMLMVMVYMGGHVSGAHYNPAVSIAVLLRGKLSFADFIPYLIAQFAGGLAGAMMAWAIRGAAPSIAPLANHFQALLGELFVTFALALVVLNAATAKKTEGNSFYGLAIGGTVLAGALSVGPASGGAFNPAVGLAITLTTTISGTPSALAPLWIYLIGPAIGGAAAAIVFKMQEGELAVSLDAFTQAAAGAAATAQAAATGTPAPAAPSTQPAAAPSTPPSDKPQG